MKTKGIYIYGGPNIYLTMSGTQEMQVFSRGSNNSLLDLKITDPNLNTTSIGYIFGVGFKINSKLSTEFSFEKAPIFAHTINASLLLNLK